VSLVDACSCDGDPHDVSTFLLSTKVRIAAKDYFPTNEKLNSLCGFLFLKLPFKGTNSAQTAGENYFRIYSFKFLIQQKYNFGLLQMG